MICPNCGKENRDASRFCTGCGNPLKIIEVETLYINPEDEKTMLMTDYENEETVILDDNTANFENEETVILDDNAVSFENEETVILNDVAAEFENEETVILDDVAAEFENEETVIIGEPATSNSDANEDETIPNFDYYGNVPVFKEDVSGTNHDTAYIDHLRALKQLWDDGIITEDEFTRKKQQILGI